MLENLRENVTSALDTLKDGIAANPLAAGAVSAGIGAVIGGGALSILGSVKKRKKKKSSSKTSRKKRSSSRSRRRRKGRRTPRTAGKGKDRSSKRIRYTKNGQPYIIKSNGRAQFIKKTSASKSHKRKGGRY